MRLICKAKATSLLLFFLLESPLCGTEDKKAEVEKTKRQVARSASCSSFQQAEYASENRLWTDFKKLLISGTAPSEFSICFNNPMFDPHARVNIQIESSNDAPANN